MKLWNPIRWWRTSMMARNHHLWAAYCGADAILHATQERERIASSNMVLARREAAEIRRQLEQAQHDLVSARTELGLARAYINELERAQFVGKS